MKIAILAPPFNPIPPLTEGGTERVISYLCAGLKGLGHEITLFAPDDSTQDVELVSAGVSVLSLENAPPSLPAAMEAISLAQLLERVGEFDVIHCHTEFMHHAALRHVRHKVVTTLHWRVDEADRQSVYSHFDDANVIAISADQASRMAGGRVSVIHHGLPASLYEPSFSRPETLAFIGRMTDQKRPDLALSVARKSGKAIRLAGARDVGNPTYFEEKVKPLLDEEAQWIGCVDDEEKQSLLQNSAALLFPIDWDEPFGLVMIEAMACGCPVIAWRRGSVPEIIEEGVTGFIVETEEEALKAVRRLGELDRRLVRKRFEERFSSGLMARKHEALFLKLTGRGND